MLAFAITLASSVAHASNPQVPQGYGNSFTADSHDTPSTWSAHGPYYAEWDIINAAGTVVATLDNPNGWGASETSGTVYVRTPANALLASNYEVRYSEAGTYGAGYGASYSGHFDVVAASNAPFTITLNPQTVSGGSPCAGKITLTNPAPSGGATVTLSTNDGTVTVPARVTVNAQSTTATFPVTTQANNGSYTVGIYATFSSGVYQKVLLNITAAPPAPTSVTARPGDKQVSLSWTASSGSSVTGYNVYRSTTSGSGYVQVNPSSVTGTTYTDPSLTDGTTYYYVVTAISTQGESSYSNEASATPTVPRFQITNINNGDTLSGTVTLQVHMASINYGDEGNQVALQVDGQDYSAGGDLRTTTSGRSGANITFLLDTEAFANQSHQLTISDVNGNATSVNVVFGNTFSSVNVPEMFDKDGGDGLATTLPISANLGTAQPWTVQIVTYDDASTVLKTFSGNSSTINVSWDGTDANGAEVDDNEYEVVLNTTTSGGAATTNANALSTATTRKTTSKNRVGDCFILIDPNVFPHKTDIKPYIQAIKNDLARSKNIVWNKLSIFVAGFRVVPSPVISRINSHFRHHLNVFYVQSHGGAYSLSNNGIYNSEFGFGSHFWHSSYSNGLPHTFHDDNLQALTASAGYGAQPPALVVIDSCKSAGGAPDGMFSAASPDYTYASDFGIAPENGGCFFGWIGNSEQYGSQAPPHDDWNFWRLDFLYQFTDPNITYDKAYSNLIRDYNTHGHTFQSGDNPTDREVHTYGYEGGYGVGF